MLDHLDDPAPRPARRTDLVTARGLAIRRRRRRALAGGGAVTTAAALVAVITLTGGSRADSLQVTTDPVSSPTAAAVLPSPSAAPTATPAQPPTAGPTATAAPSSQPTPVLGSTQFQPGPDARGFGQAHPAEIFNGGDPAGLVQGLVWQGWGSPVATATGLTSIFRPQGGYYPELVQASLRAEDLRECDGVPAYRQLYIRVPAEPGGPLGPWTRWNDAPDLCAAR